MRSADHAMEVPERWEDRMPDKSADRRVSRPGAEGLDAGMGRCIATGARGH